MSRIRDCFLELDGRKAFTAFITAGDPSAAVTVPAMHALVAGGTDLIELGMPFSDPEADGPVIQAASERALAGGMRLAGVLELVREFRTRNETTPVILMGYLNPIERMGYATFAASAADAGADGLIVVNLPPEAADPLNRHLTAHGLDLVFLVAPTTTPERVSMILERSSGFVYYVALKGVTGARHLEAARVAERVAALRAESRLPVQAGFGIQDADSAREVGRHADGIVVGAALVAIMAELEDDPAAIPDALSAKVRSLRSGLDGA